MPYPAIYAFFSKVNPMDDKKELIQDSILCSRIKIFVDSSQLMMEKIGQIIDEAVKKSPEVIIWGTGQLAMKLLSETCLSRAKIIAFVDGNPINHGNVLRGIPVRAPSEVTTLNYPIIITSTIHQNEIAQKIRQLGMKNDIIYLS
jgi:FlaA1/EpsC-like NDP-sugar epimerase